MKTIKLDKSTPYRGCGAAWAAIKNGAVVDLRYMEPPRFVLGGPKWVEAVINEAHPVVYMGEMPKDTHLLSRAKEAAIEAGYIATGVRGGKISASQIIHKAWKIYADQEQANFSKHRKMCLAELEGLGEVVSGTVSCHEFVY